MHWIKWLPPCPWTTWLSTGHLELLKAPSALAHQLPHLLPFHTLVYFVPYQHMIIWSPTNITNLPHHTQSLGPLVPDDHNGNKHLSLTVSSRPPTSVLLVHPMFSLLSNQHNTPLWAQFSPAWVLKFSTCSMSPPLVLETLEYFLLSVWEGDPDKTYD